MKNYTEEQVIEIIKAVQKDCKRNAYTTTVGRSDGFECWDVEEIVFNNSSPESFLTPQNINK